MTPLDIQAIRKDWPLSVLSVNEDILINKLCDEIERLRGALQRVCELDEEHDIYSAYAIARRALEDDSHDN